MTVQILQSSAIILSGGLGKRFGFKEKGLLLFEGEQLIERKIRLLKEKFTEIIVVTNKPELYEHLTNRILLIRDEESYCGPLMGIYSGLKASKYNINFVCAVDMPFINYKLVDCLFEFTRNFEAVVAKVKGRLEPLFGFYSKQIIAKAKHILKVNDRSNKSLRSLISCVDKKIVEETEVKCFDAELISFINFNTCDDLASWRDNAKDD
ncbi:MAG: hypothetical protein COS89_08570 [Deltaproteobacteria bacterium CG07_land_8_20_14_0_80_38_7]|nr:MAG: hypothetical protein COS89_08570 [Deltaproteobacteria bacterium CG07_land_8_20_14_0_80_38_7]